MNPQQIAISGKTSEKSESLKCAFDVIGDKNLEGTVAIGAAYSTEQASIGFYGNSGSS